MREWTEDMKCCLATDQTDEKSLAYEWSVRRMVVAGANWLEGHPDAPQVKWKQMTISKDRKPALVLAAWEEAIRVEDPALMDLLYTLDRACQNGKGQEYAPSNLMMCKALECIAFIQAEGWDKFRKEMEI